MRVSIGCAPIVWYDVDAPDRGFSVPFETIADELARLGFAASQYSPWYPASANPGGELGARGLRLAEWYVSLTVTDEGLAPKAELEAFDALDQMTKAGGEVLCVAVDGSSERDAISARIDAAAPRWPDAAFDGLADLLDQLARTAGSDRRVAFHPHVASWIEAPGEVDALAAALNGSRAGLCLDVGHYLVGGGDPVDAIRRHSTLIRHVHAKDVDPTVLARLRAWELAGFDSAVRERIFTELGNGALDLRGVVRALSDIGYDGWIMVEQDSSWLPPAEASEIGARALRAALAEVGA